MNLFLYISAQSSHPPGLTKSLIYGLIGTYWIQNSRKGDFIHTTRLLYNRLVARGYKHKYIEPIFLEVATKLHDINKLRPTMILPETKNKNEIFFCHYPFHPRDISRQAIRDIYKDIGETPDANKESFKSCLRLNGYRLEIKQMTVAYSRAKNLKDKLSSTTRYGTEKSNVKNILQEFKVAHGK